MKLTVYRQKFEKLISILASAIPNQTANANLKNFLFNITNDEVRILSSNGAVSILSKTSLKEENTFLINSEIGSVQIPASILLGAIKKMTGDIIVLEHVDDKLLYLTDEKSEFKISVSPAEDYPDIDLDCSSDIYVDLKMKDFVELYNSTYFATAKTGAKELYFGINITSRNNKLTFVATDSFRLARKYIMLDDDRPFSIIVPLASLNLVSNIPDTESLKMYIEPTRVIFKLGSFTIFSKLYNGDFPNVDKIIPTEFKYTLNVLSKEIIDSIGIVNVINLNGKQPKIQIQCTDANKVEIISKDENSTSRSPLNSAIYEGNDRFSIICNSNYVLDAIKALNSDRVTFKFVTEFRAFLISSDDDTNTQIITPIRSFTE